jgi:hypothetical protein
MSRASRPSGNFACVDVAAFEAFAQFERLRATAFQRFFFAPFRSAMAAAIYGLAANRSAFAVSFARFHGVPK